MTGEFFCKMAGGFGGVDSKEHDGFTARYNRLVWFEGHENGAPGDLSHPSGAWMEHPANSV